LKRKTITENTSDFLYLIFVIGGEYYCHELLFLIGKNTQN
jgi:hypothetical protein